MGGLLVLLALSVVMALASFLTGALPLSLTLSQSQSRLISSIGIGVLVGTSLVIIIPEGIEALVAIGGAASMPNEHRLSRLGAGWKARWEAEGWEFPTTWEAEKHERHLHPMLQGVGFKGGRGILMTSKDEKEETPQPASSAASQESPHETEHKLPTLHIGFALILGFIVMFLIDRVPRHASETLQAAPAARHISLDDLAGPSVTGDEETAGFLGSITPSPRQSRSLATTTGLVIHGAADGIAIGASATTSNMKLGFIIFFAILVHKAPAAFGLTSVLLKQGLSKRAARGHLIVFSLAAPIGALATYLVISIVGGGSMEGESGQWWTGMLLLFSAGTLLYVAMHAMQEDNSLSTHESHTTVNGYSESPGLTQRKHNKPQMRDTLATVIGLLLPLLAQFGHYG